MNILRDSWPPLKAIKGIQSTYFWLTLAPLNTRARTHVIPNFAHGVKAVSVRITMWAKFYKAVGSLLRRACATVNASIRVEMSEPQRSVYAVESYLAVILDRAVMT